MYVPEDLRLFFEKYKVVLAFAVGISIAWPLAYNYRSDLTEKWKNEATLDEKDAARSRDALSAITNSPTYLAGYNATNIITYSSHTQIVSRLKQDIENCYSKQKSTEDLAEKYRLQAERSAKNFEYLKTQLDQFATSLQLTTPETKTLRDLVSGPGSDHSKSLTARMFSKIEPLEKCLRSGF